MSSRLFLEEFDMSARAPARPEADPNSPVVPSLPGPTAEMVEQARLDGYEAGYKAGWDDAARAESEGQGRIGAEFSRNLQDLGFTFHEARSHVMHMLEPLLAGMVERVLPELVSRTVGQSIVEELLPLASLAADTPIEVVVSPASRPAIEPMLAAAAVPFSLVEEPTLAEGQVFLRSGQIERHIDFTDAVDRIGAAINGLYELNEKAFRNG
jgi:flagellar biosynthesis/type III secretory pathway protein FliH